MTEPKRWTAGDIVALYMSDDQHWRDEFYAAADFDRLRDERDEMIRVSTANIATTQRNMDELRRVAGVLADALRKIQADCPGGAACCCNVADDALAVFDTLTARAIAEEATRFECGDTLEDAHPDPPCAHGLTGGRGADERCLECGAAVTEPRPENPYRTVHARMSPPGAAWDEGFAAGRAAASPDPPDEEATDG